MVDGIALRHCLFNLLHLTDLGIELKKAPLTLQNQGASNGGCLPPQSKNTHKFSKLATSVLRWFFCVSIYCRFQCTPKCNSLFSQVAKASTSGLL